MSGQPTSRLVMVVKLGGMDVASGSGIWTRCVCDSNPLGGKMSTLRVGGGWRRDVVKWKAVDVIIVGACVESVLNCEV